MAGHEVIYRIYRITSPSGKCYVGLTKTSIWQRWRGHVKLSRTGLNHPFYNAIRKYGEDAFVLEHIACALGKANAGATEQACIAQTPQCRRYNLSPGGEADGEHASKAFWDRMRSDPVAMEAYRAKLVQAQADRAPIRTEQRAYVLAKGAEWRKDNPKTAWKNSYRASRVSARGATGVGRRRDDRTLKERLLAKHKSVFPRRAAGVAAVWARLSEAEHATLTAKIAEGQRRSYAEDPARQVSTAKQLRAARENIDREVQGRQASKGLKAYWANLKKDPEKYAAHMATRTASLMKTLEAKKCK